VAFWVYCVLATVFSLGIYLIIWSTQHFTIAQMTPVSLPPFHSAPSQSDIRFDLVY